MTRYDPMAAAFRKALRAGKSQDEALKESLKAEIKHLAAKKRPERAK